MPSNYTFSSSPHHLCPGRDAYFYGLLMNMFDLSKDNDRSIEEFMENPFLVAEEASASDEECSTSESESDEVTN